jgi:hypothetical protein
MHSYGDAQAGLPGSEATAFASGNDRELEQAARAVARMATTTTIRIPCSQAAASSAADPLVLPLRAASSRSPGGGHQ